MLTRFSFGNRADYRQDLTPAVVYLLSDAASFTTGTDIVISGGIHAGTSMEWAQRSMA